MRIKDLLIWQFIAWHVFWGFVEKREFCSHYLSCCLALVYSRRRARVLASSFIFTYFYIFLSRSPLFETPLLTKFFLSQKKGGRYQIKAYAVHIIKPVSPLAQKYPVPAAVPARDKTSFEEVISYRIFQRVIKIFQWTFWKTVHGDQKVKT